MIAGKDLYPFISIGRFALKYQQEVNKSDNTHSDNHTTPWKDYVKKRRVKAKKLGKCRDHWSRNAVPGKTLCEECLEARREYNRAGSARLLEGEGCPICGREGEVLLPSFDRRTGEPRGRICTGCNTGIGFLRDDPAVIARAARYLKRFARLESADISIEHSTAENGNGKLSTENGCSSTGIKTS